MFRYLIGIVLSFIILIIFWILNQSGINIHLRNFGWGAFFALSLSLMITPLAEITQRQDLRPYRKVFGVLAFLLGIIHTSIYFYYEYIYNGTFFVLKHFYGLDVASGLIAIFIISLLGVTSFNAFHRAMGKYWKSLHMLVFPLFCIVSLHIAFASRFDLKYMILISFVVLLRVIASQKKGISAVQFSGKYLCVPCGYIYDPALGDPDSGIAPGTSFEMIPGDWKCPICGVSKSDFIPYNETKSSNKNISGKVVSIRDLNETTREFSIEFKEVLKVIPGQFAKIVLKDIDREFSRSYSVVNVEGKRLTFCVKISTGRGSKSISKLRLGDTLGLEGIFGAFILQHTNNPKVFIATGTGLAPIINMLGNLSKDIQKFLYFGVRKKEDIFYEDKIKAVQGLQAFLYLSQEELSGYTSGRIDVSGFLYPKNTEFYICGNPEMVHTYTENLQKLGYTNIYSEKFS